MFQGIVIDKIADADREDMVQVFVIDGFLEIIVEIVAELVFKKQRGIVAVEYGHLATRRKPPIVRKVEIPQVEVLV